MSRTLARRLQLGLFLGATTLLAPSVLAEGTVAVVDTQRAVMETEDGLRMQATLKKLFDQRQRELDKQQNELQKEREDLEKQRGVLSPEALAERAGKWQAEMAQVQQRFVNYNKELQTKQNEMMQPILQKTLGVVRKIATQEGYAIVVEKQAAPYSRADLDLTDRVIQSSNGGSSKASAPAARTKPNSKK